ncbi:hypothetical protein N8499_02960, partial [Akkermansiaceae bacterium]|nr:hypothetical protein [Akkermansiaceae bacterium]
MPTIRFKNDTDARVADHRKNFLESLDLDPALWGEEQALELSPTTRPRIFDIEMPVPACLLESEQWVARFERFDGFICFIVGDHTWAASVAGAKDLQSAVKELPADLSCLKLANRQTLQDLSPLSGLTQLTSLNFVGCEALTDLSPLSGLTQLTSLGFLSSRVDRVRLRSGDLTMISCKGLTDLTPLSGLTQLTSLIFERCRALTDLSPLSGLTQLTSLNLESCKASDLSPLSGLRQLTSLNFSVCNSVTDLTPLSGLRQLTGLNLSFCSSLADLTPLSG